MSCNKSKITDRLNSLVGNLLLVPLVPLIIGMVILIRLWEGIARLFPGKLRPGDKARLKQDVWRPWDDHTPDDAFCLYGTKGSIGTIVSFDEYRADYVESLKRLGIAKSDTDLEDYTRHLLSERREIETHAKYPLKFEKIIPVSDEHLRAIEEGKASPDSVPYVVLACEEGHIRLFNASMLAKIE